MMLIKKRSLQPSLNQAHLKKSRRTQAFFLALHSAPGEPLVLVGHRDFVGVAIQRNR
jgi:hypothetical protein